MNREIKFRAFQDNEMLYSKGSGVYATKDFFKRLYEDSNVMQFTGLKDKNGKEIYEGDIVEWFSKFAGTNIETPAKRGTVKFQDQTVSYIISYQDIENRNYYKEFNADYGDETGCYMNSIEIIGNIYQNPELFK